MKRLVLFFGNRNQSNEHIVSKAAKKMRAKGGECSKIIFSLGHYYTYANTLPDRKSSRRLPSRSINAPSTIVSHTCTGRQN